MLGVLGDIGARSAADVLRPALVTLSEAPGAGIALVGGLGMALWSASRYVRAFGRAMNRIYHIDEGRPAWKLRPLIMLVTLVTVLLTGVVALGLVLGGPVAESVGSALGLGPAAVLAWGYVKWPVLLCALAFVVGLLYHATPNVRQPRFQWLRERPAVTTSRLPTVPHHDGRSSSRSWSSPDAPGGGGSPVHNGCQAERRRRDTRPPPGRVGQGEEAEGGLVAFLA